MCIIGYNRVIPNFKTKGSNGLWKCWLITIPECMECIMRANVAQKQIKCLQCFNTKGPSGPWIFWLILTSGNKCCINFSFCKFDRLFLPEKTIAYGNYTITRATFPLTRCTLVFAEQAGPIHSQIFVITHDWTTRQQRWLLGCSCDLSHGSVWGTSVTHHKLVNVCFTRTVTPTLVKILGRTHLCSSSTRLRYSNTGSTWWPIGSLLCTGWSRRWCHRCWWDW